MSKTQLVHTLINSWMENKISPEAQEETLNLFFPIKVHVNGKNVEHCSSREAAEISIKKRNDAAFLLGFHPKAYSITKIPKTEKIKI